MRKLRSHPTMYISSFVAAQASPMDTGNVSIHAATISLPTPQRTADSRLVAPTPMMAVLIVWVVRNAANC